MIERFQYVFLDSGVGGIPYLNYLLKLDPKATALYVADSKHFPYGEKTQEEVISFTIEIVKEILKKIAPQIIILACNTMTVSALKTLRNIFNFPFVGTVPAIKPANLVTKNHRIGLISTERTAKDIYIQRLIDKFLPDSKVFVRGEGELVEKIENGLLFENEEEQLKAIRPIMSFFENENCDALILGCTHFLHLRDSFINAGSKCKNPITIVDSLEGVVNQTLSLSPCKSTSRKVALTTTGNQKEKYVEYANRYGFDFIEYIHI
ncbi:MAG: glutamate racemase [Treponema sp.]